MASRLQDPSATTATSDITVAELHRVGRSVPEISPQQVDAVLANIDLVPLSPEQLRAAGLLPGLPAGFPLRTLDAIHLQAALDFGATELLTSDRRQAAAAKALGLAVRVLS